jgi:light-regulated signal transduction histidine kinase (bacteriophytochrome)
VGDTRLITIVLVNPLGNAWKYTGKTESGEISFGQREDESEQIFFVRDNGAGFDMAYAGKLFAPFQRMHRDSEFEGTGIGLATAHRIVSRHGGRMWAEAKVDAGATFSFTLGE